MSDQFNSDDEVLARLVREAGDPSVSPDPQYAQTLRATILDRVGPAETIAHVTEANREADVRPMIAVERTRKMKRIAKLAVAATILVAMGIFFSWIVIGGGSTSIALAQVAEALENLRTATYELTMEMRNPMDGKTITVKSKAWILAPSLERVETSTAMGSVNAQSSSIMILDHQAMKGLVLAPEQKLAMTMDLTKIKKPAGGPPNMFEMVRQLVREGTSGSGENVESLGKKKLNGRAVVGFRIHNNFADMTFWADPQTAQLVQVETDLPEGNGHGVMSNFCFDMELDPSLFSLEPPAGYTVENKELKMPVEEDLVNFLRFIAEHNAGTFPTAIGMTNKQYHQAVQAEAKSESDKLLKTPEAQQLMEKLKAQYGEDKDGFMKVWMKEWMKMAGPITQKLVEKNMQGVLFYTMLQPENDSHYAGKDVKLDTPDRPIFWYKPTGADKYRVIYADLSVKEMTPDDVKKLAEATPE